MDKSLRLEIQKIREICFVSLPPGQAERALALLGSVGIGKCPDGRCIVIGYDLLEHTLTDLEAKLAAAGLQFDDGLFQRIRRALIRHCEHCQLTNLQATTRDENLRRVYANAHNRPLKAAELLPEEWRDYR